MGCTEEVSRQQLQSSSSKSGSGRSGVARSGSGSRAAEADGRLGTAAWCDDVWGMAEALATMDSQTRFWRGSADKRNRAKRGTTTHNVVL